MTAATITQQREDQATVDDRHPSAFHGISPQRAIVEAEDFGTDDVVDDDWQDADAENDASETIFEVGFVPSGYQLFAVARTKLMEEFAICQTDAIKFIDDVDELAMFACISTAQFAWVEEDTPFHDFLAAVFPDDTIAQPGTAADAITRLVLPPGEYEAGMRLRHSKAPRDGRHHCSMHATLTAENTGN